MYKTIFLALALSITVLASCDKTEYTPDGPTDIRVHNVNSFTYDSVEIINKSLETNKYGTVNPGEYTEYKRFETAYPREHVKYVYQFCLLRIPS